MENNIITKEQLMAMKKMTSIEIAQLTGKLHKDVMKAIRNMEPAWEQERGRKFALSQIREKIANGGYKLRPCYLLDKTETLFVATKFNDMARARLVLRWAELERGLRTSQLEQTACRMLETEKEILKRSDAIRQQQISSENADAERCLTTRDVARALGMTVKELNRLLVARGVVYRDGGSYKLEADYEGRGLAQERAFHYFGLEGEKKERHYLVWTPEGAEIIKDMVN